VLAVTAMLAATAMAVVPSAHSVAASVAPSGAPPSGARLLFRLADPRINEASGIAAGITSPGVVYVHNDSGDAPRFFALDARTGATLAVYTVPGAAAIDWEDIAVAPDARGVPSVWLADIGDNHGVRREIQLYRVDEPRVDPTRRDVAVPSSPAEVWRLRYPDGAADAESLAVAPDGTPYLVTKSPLGGSTVFAAPRQAREGQIQRLRKLGSIQFALTNTPGPFSLAGHLMATGADISRDGSLMTVRTYTDAYLWRLPGGDVAAGLRGTPVRVPLPEQPQGEGIAIAGTRLLIDSEQTGSAVYAVPIPATHGMSAPSTSAPSTSAPSTSAPSTSAPTPGAPASVAAPSAASASATRTRRSAGTAWLLWLGAAAIIAGGARTLWIARRRRSGRAAARPR
jgi:hypothetical protein